MNGTEYNQKIQNGLRVQYSAERTNEIIHQASAAWHCRNPHTKNNPELYELFESGLIDEALETLGYGKWAIGRPKSGNGSQNNKSRLSIFRATNNKPNGRSGRSLKPVERPLVANTPQPNNPPSVTELFRAHVPGPGELRKPYSDWSNAIEYRNLLVVGGPGEGKTTLNECLVECLSDTYRPFAVEAWKQTGGVDRLLVYGTAKPAKAHYLLGDDLTQVELPRSHLNAFFQVRHLIHAQTGLNAGLVITSFNSHTLFGIDKSLRTTFAMLLLKTIPTNPYDRVLLKKYFDSDLLARFEREAKDDDVLVWDKFHQSGVWAKVPLPGRNVLKQVPPRATPQLSLLAKGLVVGTVAFVLVMLLSVLPRLLTVRGS